jgi:hypothetical protein
MKVSKKGVGEYQLVPTKKEKETIKNLKLGESFSVLIDVKSIRNKR